MSHKHTSATPAGVPRSRDILTRRERRLGAVGRCSVCRRLCAILFSAGGSTPKLCVDCERDLYPDDEPRRGFDSDDPDDDYCDTCDNTGVILTCCDDICVARGECIHGDGEEVCPDCEGRCL